VQALAPVAAFSSGSTVLDPCGAVAGCSRTSLPGPTHVREPDGHRCPDDGSIVLWHVADGLGDPIQVPENGHVPVTLLDVDGETIAIEIWAGDHMEDWLPKAQKIVDSIRFLSRPPAEASPAGPTPSP
jgi:hypothetical protein